MQSHNWLNSKLHGKKKDRKDVEKKQKPVKKNPISFTKAIKKREKKSKNTDGTFSKKRTYKKIRTSILCCFLIPILLLCILGFLSYQISSGALVNNYKDLTLSVIKADSNYLASRFQEIATQSLKVSTNTDFASYYRSKNMNAKDLASYKLSIVDDLKRNSFVVDGIRNMYVINGDREPIWIGNESIASDAYSRFVKEEVQDGEVKTGWCGLHTSLDKTNDQRYGLTYIKEALNGNVYLVTDVEYTYIQDSLDEMTNDNCIVGVATKDGREIYSKKSNMGEKQLFHKKDSAKETIMKAEHPGNTSMFINDEEYLCTYSEIGDTDIVLFNLIPNSVILKEAYTIRNTSVFVTVFAVLVSFIIGYILAAGICKAINSMKFAMERVSQGDLTVEFKTKRQDEFKVLAQSLANMVKNMKNLITDVAQVSHHVDESSAKLMSTSEVLLDSSKNIAVAVNEVALGATNQVEDTDNTLRQMTVLAESVSKAYTEMKQIETLFSEVNQSVDRGTLLVNDLNNKSQETSTVTSNIVSAVNDLEVNSKSIESIVNTMNEISEQTNLLSLNASIEAARAGEFGKGFSVVASEIGKLALKSIQATAQINDIIQLVQKQTNFTVNTAKKASDIVVSQGESLDNTIKVYHSIADAIKQLVYEVDVIKSYMLDIENAKKDAMDSIVNISSVSEQAAAAAQEVSATVTNQTEEMEQLNSAAEKLDADAKILVEAIKRFTV